MPDRPTLLHFFRCRFGPAAHVLQSASHALAAGQPENTVLACLLHDIAVIGFIRADHGYWARSSSSRTSTERSRRQSATTRCCGSIRIPSSATSTRKRTCAISATRTRPSRTSRRRMPTRASTAGTQRAARSPCTTSIRSTRPRSSRSRRSRISSRADSVSRMKASASTRARPRTCGARSTRRPAFSDPRPADVRYVMGTLVIHTHGRLREWIAEEHG